MTKYEQKITFLWRILTLGTQKSSIEIYGFFGKMAISQWQVKIKNVRKPKKKASRGDTESKTTTGSERVASR